MTHWQPGCPVVHTVFEFLGGEADSECPRFQSTVIQPLLLQLNSHGTLAEILRRVFGTSKRKWLSKHLR